MAARRAEEEACTSYAELAALAEARGYKQGWAGIRWKERKRAQEKVENQARAYRRDYQ
jgi:hypothetical protein